MHERRLVVLQCLLFGWICATTTPVAAGFCSYRPRLGKVRPVTTEHWTPASARLAAASEEDSLEFDRLPKKTTSTTSTSSSRSNTISDLTTDPATLLTQAQALRDEASALRTSLDQAAEQRQVARLARMDDWIDDLLVAQRLPDDTQVLYTPTQVTQRLQDKRMADEHILQIFRRLSDAHGPQSRSRLSPMVELLVDACGLMDAVDREEQPNKRWSGRVERKLRCRLFAADWGIDLEELEEDKEEGNTR
jgi:hypothetical protein